MGTALKSLPVHCVICEEKNKGKQDDNDFSFNRTLKIAYCTYAIPSALLNFKCTRDMISSPTGLCKAAKCCSFQSTATAFKFCSSSQFRLQIFNGVTVVENSRCPEMIYSETINLNNNG